MFRSLHTGFLDPTVFFCSAEEESDGDAPSSQSNSKDTAGPCADTPHCTGFDEHHRKKPVERALEHKFLYSAHSKYIQCMDYYARQPGFDIACKSCDMNARQWAGLAVGPGKRRPVQIPDDVEQWLKEHNL